MVINYEQYFPGTVVLLSQHINSKVHQRDSSKLMKSIEKYVNLYLHVQAVCRIHCISDQVSE